jgi:MFS family permease
MFKAPFLTKTIRVLSLISLLNIASEMLYPVIPLYLKSIGFSIAIIGVLEGVAEALSGLSKGYFGKLSDNTGRRLPFVRWGYFLSTIAKPMMVVFSMHWWVFTARTLDRFGKGVRTGARDALLSDEATDENKGKVFGFYKAADTVAAFAGPALALWYLSYHEEDYKPLFYFAFFPGLMALLLSFLIKDKKRVLPPRRKSASLFSMLHYWKASNSKYRKVVAGLLVFTLFNSSDVFLLLKVEEAGFSDTVIIKMYIFYNFVLAIAAYPVGVLADKIRLRVTFLIGLAIYAAVYLGMAFTETAIGFYTLFFLYGLFAATNEGIAKAWISNIADRKDTATALGTYSGLHSIFTMLASTLTGLVWYEFGAKVAFSVTALMALVVMVYFMFLRDTTRKKPLPENAAL